MLKDELEKSQLQNQKNEEQLRKEGELEQKIQDLQNDLVKRMSEYDKLKILSERQKKELQDKDDKDHDKQAQLENLKALFH